MEQNYQMKPDEIEIDLVELIGVIMSKLWLVIISGVLLGLISFILSMYVITPQYQSTTKMYIINRQSSETLTYSDIQTGTQLTKDYQELVTSRPVLESVISELGLDIDNATLKSKISVDVPTDTRIVTITVEDSDPNTAQSIANAIRDSASEHIAKVMNTEAVNVVEEADLPEEPSSPKIMKNTMIGAVVGIFIAVVVIIFVYVMDDTIKNPDDIERYLKVSLLGSIPYVDEKAANDYEKKRKSRKNKKDDDKDVVTPVIPSTGKAGSEVSGRGY